MPVYKSMTIRNWNTSTKLAQMLEGDEVNDRRPARGPGA